MKDKIVQNVDSIGSNALATELQSLFTEAVTVRYSSGMTNRLRQGYVRDVINDGDEGFTELVPVAQDECIACSCTEGETCAVCEPELEDVCSIEDVVDLQRELSPFHDVANLLTTVKKYEFISLVENAYAQIGNKPFKLKATKDPTITEEQFVESANVFYEYLETFLETNEVRIDEIPDAFNLDTLSEVTQVLADTVQQESAEKVRKSIDSNEIVLERIFKRSEFMAKYIEVIKDTTDYPLGILWIDDKSLKKERVIKKGVLKFNYTIQADVSRVDPCYFWTTEDYSIDNIGKAVFKMEQFTSGDLIRIIDHKVSGSKMIDGAINEYLGDHPNGYRMNEAMLFEDHRILNKGIYDILVCRGTFDKEYVEQLNVEIPEEYNKDSHIPCEIYFSGGQILKVRVMVLVDDRLGVYTTVFRRKGKGLSGYSLHEFIYPFAKLYAGSIDAVDRSVGKSIGSIIQIDTSVIENPDKYLNKNTKIGEVTLDLSEDMIVEFDSSAAAFTSPNFKGVPITVDQLPSDLNKLLPVVDFIHRQLEIISGIPNMLVNGSNISSALRTTSNFNAAFTASAKVIQSLLRESENRILKPSIQYMFDSEASSGNMREFLLEAEPEILLSDTLAREINDNQELLTGLQTLTPYIGIIPQEKFAALLNTFGKLVLGLDDDLVPGVGALKTSAPSDQTQSV